MSSPGDKCNCPEAVAWREYWTVEAIAERLQHETELYRKICHERWQSVAEDTKRDEARLPASDGPSYAELARRRAE